MHFPQPRDITHSSRSDAACASDVSQLPLPQSISVLQNMSMRHGMFGHASLPQSISVSRPSWIPLPQLVHTRFGSASVPMFVQVWLEQSRVSRHPSPSLHWPHTGPPQSTSVSNAGSFALSNPSTQSISAVGAHALLTQLFVSQSLSCEQLDSTGQERHPPPQPTSVSSPFIAPSPHDTHVQLLRKKDESSLHTCGIDIVMSKQRSEGDDDGPQSPGRRHLRPVSHCISTVEHLGPPQSTSDSSGP